MRITPLDVRKQEFRRGMRGYDADEVRAFLTTLADEYEAVLVDNKQLRERVLEQDEKLAEYRNLERTLRDTLMTAERVAQEARETAHKQGELLIGEARQRVERVLADGRAQLDDLRRQALALHREKEAFLSRFRSLAETQIQFVEMHRSDFKALDGRLLDQLETGAGPAVDDGAYVRSANVEPPRKVLETGRDQWRHYDIAEAARATADDVAAAANAAAVAPGLAEAAAPNEPPVGEDHHRLAPGQTTAAAAHDPS
ncbi:MAG: DivIVA domain-containing protein [Candidatus Krumholzibacteria bacterium]|nr:DivIVA domain-containing protein [Candidatus Krumholzibacteria bacterium]